MNAEWLLALYERVAEAPDAIARLRRFVLDLAVRGKLVEQEPADEPASELLKRIAAERVRLVEAGEIRKPKKLPPVDAGPFDLPNAWRWVRMREVTSDRGQKVPDSDFTYIDVTSINKEVGVVADPKVLAKDEAPSRARKMVTVGDVIYSCVRPYLLNVAVLGDALDPPPIASTAFAVLNGYGLILPWYLWIALRSPFMVDCVEEHQRGQAYPAINDADFALLPFPLPPLAEQQRIVAKVEELMALLDRLEAARKRREATRDRLTTASLARLTAPDTELEEFPAHARFAIDALPALTSRPDQIKALRQAILNLAVRGQLTFDTTTHIGHPACTSAAENALRPYDIHSAWTWFLMDELVHFQGGSQPPKSSFIYAPREGYIRLVQIRDFKSEAHLTFVPEAKANRPFTEEDVMIGRYGPPVFQILRGLSGTYNVALMKASPKSDLISKDFLFLLLQESRIHDQVVQESERTAGQTGVRLPLLRSFIVALPPLPEQRRIVAKVDELMALCDRLEAALSAADTTRARLLESLLHEALTPACEPELEAA